MIHNKPREPEAYLDCTLIRRGKPLFSGLCRKCGEIYYSIGKTGYCSNKCAHFVHGLHHGYKVLHRVGSTRIVEHRHVMKAPKGYIVHHKNGNRLDNRKENLEIMKQADHVKIHSKAMSDARWGL